MKGRYIGGAWRSRFLRSPKIAQTLTDRKDFAALGDLAQVLPGREDRSGKFFFLTMTAGETSAKPAVEGLTGWRGQIGRPNLRLALRIRAISMLVVAGDTSLFQLDTFRVAILRQPKIPRCGRARLCRTRPVVGHPPTTSRDGKRIRNTLVSPGPQHAGGGVGPANTTPRTTTLLPTTPGRRQFSMGGSSG